MRRADEKDKAILRTAVQKIKALPPMNIDAFREAATNALRDAAAEHEARQKNDPEAQ